jgi:hypothetical protein
MHIAILFTAVASLLIISGCSKIHKESGITKMQDNIQLIITLDKDLQVVNVKSSEGYRIDPVCTTETNINQPDNQPPRCKKPHPQDKTVEKLPNHFDGYFQRKKPKCGIVIIQGNRYKVCE